MTNRLLLLLLFITDYYLFNLYFRDITSKSWDPRGLSRRKLLQFSTSTGSLTTHFLKLLKPVCPKCRGQLILVSTQNGRISEISSSARWTLQDAQILTMPFTADDLMMACTKLVCTLPTCHTLCNRITHSTMKLPSGGPRCILLIVGLT